MCLVVVRIGEFISWRVADFSQSYSQVRAVLALWHTSIKNLLSRPARFFENELSGTITSRVNQASGALESLDDITNWSFPSFLSAVIASSIALMWFSPWLLIYMFGWLGIMGGVLYFFMRYLAPYRDRAFTAESHLSGNISDVFGGIMSILALGTRNRHLHTVDDFAQKYATARRTSWNRQNVLYAFLGGMLSLAASGIFYLMYWKSLHGSITVAQVTLLIGILPMFLDITFGMKNLIDRVSQTLAQGRGLRELLENSTAPEPSGLPDISIPHGALELKDLSFGYVPERNVFDHLNLSIQPGERVALVGPSGAGKSTLLKLALCLYLPSNGAVLVDGKNIAHFDPDSLRRQVALVPQEAALFHRSIYENVILARENASRADVEKSLRAAHAWEIVEHLPEGMDSIVGERGVKLSGGERQRIALARAFLRDAKIILLDEPTSALDSASERAIQAAMSELLKGRTSLTIAHRLSTVMHADRIVVMKHGKIVEQGTHEKLLATGGLYAKLWNLQAGGMLGDTEFI